MGNIQTVNWLPLLLTHKSHRLLLSDCFSQFYWHFMVDTFLRSISDWIRSYLWQFDRDCNSWHCYSQKAYIVVQYMYKLLWSILLTFYCWDFFWRSCIYLKLFVAMIDRLLHLIEFILLKIMLSCMYWQYCWVWRFFSIMASLKWQKIFIWKWEKIVKRGHIRGKMFSIINWQKHFKVSLRQFLPW